MANRKDKRFNITGRLIEVKTGQTQSGDTWLSAKLVREGKKALTVAAFTEKADKLIAEFGENAAVRLFGFFRTQRFTPADAAGEITFQQFYVLGAEAPGTPRPNPAADTGDSAPAESVDDAYFALQAAQGTYELDPSSLDAKRALEQARTRLERAIAASDAAMAEAR